MTNRPSSPALRVVPTSPLSTATDGDADPLEFLDDPKNLDDLVDKVVGRSSGGSSTSWSGVAAGTGRGVLMAELEKAYFQTEMDNVKIAFLYNPDSLKLTFSNKWDGDKLLAGGDDALKFGGASPAKMSLELVFDTTNTGQPVTKYT